MKKLITNLDTILDTLSTACLIGACISAVVMLYNAIGGRWNELIEIVPMSDDLINSIVDCLTAMMPIVTATWGFWIWVTVVKRVNEKSEEVEDKRV